MSYKYIKTPQGNALVKIRYRYKNKMEVNSTFKDSAGHKYNQMFDGSIRRVDAKSWHGKSERRKIIRQRRLSKV